MSTKWARFQYSTENGECRIIEKWVYIGQTLICHEVAKENESLSEVF